MTATYNAHCHIYDCAVRLWRWCGLPTAERDATIAQVESRARECLALAERQRVAGVLAGNDESLCQAIGQWINWRTSGTLYSNQDFDVQQSLNSAITR